MDTSSKTGGLVKLQDLFPDAWELFVGFKNWLSLSFESVTHFFLHLDNKRGIGLLSRDTFVEGCQENGFEGDASMLFSAFDLDNTGQISAEELMCLEDNVMNREAMREAIQLGQDPVESKQHNKKVLQSRGKKRRLA